MTVLDTTHIDIGMPSRAFPVTAPGIRFRSLMQMLSSEYGIFWHNFFLKIQLIQSRFPVDELPVSYVAKTASFGLL